jgi:hypothetical protein
MDYFTHDGTWLIALIRSNIAPSPQDGETVEAGIPEGYTPRPEGARIARFTIRSQHWEDPRSPAQKIEDEANAAREKRDRLLAECDWTQMPDVALERKSAWAADRQACPGRSRTGGVLRGNRLAGTAVPIITGPGQQKGPEQGAFVLVTLR